MEQELYDMEMEREERPSPEGPSKPVSYKVHPGFFCFFEDYVQRNQLTFTECYERLVNSSLHMSILTKDMQQIVTQIEEDRPKLKKNSRFKHTDFTLLPYRILSATFKKNEEPEVKIYLSARDVETELDKERQRLEQLQGQSLQLLQRKRELFRQKRQAELEAKREAARMRQLQQLEQNEDSNDCPAR